MLTSIDANATSVVSRMATPFSGIRRTSGAWESKFMRRSIAANPDQKNTADDAPVDNHPRSRRLPQCSVRTTQPNQNESRNPVKSQTASVGQQEELFAADLTVSPSRSLDGTRLRKRRMVQFMTTGLI